MNESQLVYQIMREVGKYAAVFRTNAGAAKLPGGAIFRGLPKGFSDVMVVLPGGGAAFIEAKTDTGKATPEQERFIERMRSLGARAGIARSVAEAMRICGLDSAR